jgi:hypothetical protein
MVVGRRRVAGTRKKQQCDHHCVPKLALNDHEGDRDGQQQEGNAVCPAPDEGVQNVAAIELADRHQIERCDEDSYPTGKQPGIQVNVAILRDWPKVKPRQPL